ncbi:MAG TPA: hypothetical protein VHP83_17055, partial [Aggregatilineaceae bacterium]|nr:hypothetical protein [Aggregatilineaceae bacterium]
FILGMFLMIGSIGLLAAVRRADTNSTPLPGESRYRYRGFIRYQFYFLLVALPLAILAALTAPVSSAIAILAALVALLIGNGYMLRFVLRLKNWTSFGPVIREGSAGPTPSPQTQQG